MQIASRFSYVRCIENSMQVYWQIDDIITADAELDFTRRFLPNSLAGTVELDGLSEEEKLSLNHIRANSYAHLFAFVEEYIIAVAVEHATAEIFGNETELRALLRFAEEEAKHQAMFKRFADIFARQYPVECGLIGDAEAVAGVILDHSPLAVMLVTLHLELVTQDHYLHSFRREDPAELEPAFVRMFKFHWLEEAQHAKIDMLELEKMVQVVGDEQIDQAITDYLKILEAFDGLLQSQASFDVESLERAVDRTFGEDEREKLRQAQHQSYRDTFIVLGMENEDFRITMAEIQPAGRDRVDAAVARFTEG